MGAAILRQPAPIGAGLAYRKNIVNYCPGCTHTNWMIGRMVAECGFCGTVLRLAPSAMNVVDLRRG